MMENQAPGGEAHPALHNAVILDNIFEQLTQGSGPSVREEARNFRAVCKSWMDASRAQFERLQPTIVFNQCSSHPYNGKSLRDFIDLMETSSSIPYRSFKFGVGSFSGCDAYPLFNEFLFSLCGQGAVNLQLQLTLEQLGKIDFGGLVDLSLDNLRKLSIELVVHDEQKLRKAGIVSPVGLLLGAAQSATSFRLRYAGAGARPMQRGPQRRPLVESQLVRAVSRNLPASIVELSLSGVLLDRRGARLLNQTAGLALKTLGFYFRATVEIGKEVQMLLDSQAATLRELAVRGNHDDEEEYSDVDGRRTENFVLIMPSMLKLVHLQLYELSVAPFSFSAKLPALTTLDTDEWGYNDDVPGLLETLRESRTTPSTTIVRLHLRLCSSQTVQLIQPIANHLPSLAELHLANHSSHSNLKGTLRRIFSQLTSIQRLSISMGINREEGALNLDAIFTGQEEAVCRELRWGNARMMENVELLQGVSLLNLKGLKKLDIQCLGRYARCILTDVSALLVFLRMEQLEELSLSNAAFSLPVYNRLKERMKRLECYVGPGALLTGTDYPAPLDDHEEEEH